MLDCVTGTTANTATGTVGRVFISTTKIIKVQQLPANTWMIAELPYHQLLLIAQPRQRHIIDVAIGSQFNWLYYSGNEPCSSAANTAWRAVVIEAVIINSELGKL